MPNLVKFREDPDAMLVMALEDYDEVTGKAKPKPRSCSKTWSARARRSPTFARPRKGLLVSLDRTGGIDLPLIASLYGKPEETIARRTGRSDLPRSRERKAWQTADAYLSGNVRDKLKAAEHGRPGLLPATPWP